MGTVAMERAPVGVKVPMRITSALTVLARHGLLDAARQVYLHVTAREIVRETLHRNSGVGRDHSIDKARAKSNSEDSHLIHVACELVRFSHAGATPAELLRVPQYVNQVLTSLGVMTPRPLGVLDLAESKIDGDEDNFFTRRVVHGLRPQALREEAEVNRKAAAIYLERAAALDVRAARLELGVVA